MRIAIIEPYFSGSHRAWAEGYQRFSRHDIVLVTHEARFWKWRMQGGAATLASDLHAEIGRGGPVDVVLGTSMLNLPALLGLAYRDLGDATVAIFMHENQLSYPLSSQDKPDQTYAMVNWLSMLAADLVLFNSEFHRDDWFGELSRFLRQFPDHEHEDFIPAVRRRSRVVPVGVDLRRFDDLERTRGPVPRIVWNQRWEYDKGPTSFARAMGRLAERGLDFELVIAGEQFVSNPPAFERLQRRLGDRLVHYGYASDDAYDRFLMSSDIVVSTANQEYFGIAITEAIYAGAFPVLPNRLVYPERLPVEVHDQCLYHGEEELVDLITWALQHREAAQAIADSLYPVMSLVDWSAVAPLYDALLEDAVARGRE